MSIAGYLWKNFPVPESHVTGIVIGICLHNFLPWNISWKHRHRAVGWALLGCGLTIIGWAVRTVGHDDIEHPTVLVTAGPYRWSRNPMYVAWSVIYLSLALLVNTAWVLVVFPAVAIACHRTVCREERTLQQRFGETYRAYAQDVPRYL